MILGIAFLIAIVCAALMGYAIQRGATCTVAAMQEIVTQRRANRLVALMEASFWVAGGLILASLVGLPVMRPASFAPGGWTIAGGALLGVGAYINRACVFGAIARFGSGEWAYALTPLGFFIGCLSVAPLFQAMAPMRLKSPSPVLAASAWLAVPFAAFAAWRLGQAMAAARRSGLAAHIWSSHHATSLIGITFVLMMLTVGAWAYTDLLADLARGMAGKPTARLILFAALFAGAVAGGWTAGRLRHEPPTFPAMVRCLVGGILMGWGSALIPGGNDGLILVGMPLLMPYAWIAFATMCVVIAAALIAECRLVSIYAAAPKRSK